MKEHSPRSNQVPVAALDDFWTRTLFGCYALLFAAVFPFICWGGLSGEDHPHLLPHFVFFEPAASQPHPLTTSSNRHTHMAMLANQPLYEPGTAHPPVMPIGRAAPAMLIFSLCMLLWGAGSIVICSEQPLFLLRQVQLFPTCTVLPVPHPPPRLSC